MEKEEMHMNRDDLELCRLAYDDMPVALFIENIVLNEAGEPIDWVTEYMNPAAGKLAHYDGKSLVGNYFLRDLYPDVKNGKYALQYLYDSAYGDARREYHQHIEALDKYLKLLIYPWKTKGYCVCMASDESSQVYAQRKSEQNAEENTNLIAQLSLERKQYRDALFSNSYFSYHFDLTEGIVYDQIITSDKESLTEKLGISLPMSFTEMSDAFTKISELQYAESYMKDYWTQEGLLRAYEEGVYNAESDYYVPSLDHYYHVNALLYEPNEDGHIHALIICRDMTELEKEKHLRKKQERESAHIQDILVTDYISAYYINVVTDEYKTLKIHQNINAKRIIERSDSYTNVMEHYIDTFVLPGYQQQMHMMLRRKHLKEYLDHHDRFLLRFQTLPNADGGEYFEIYAKKVDDEHIVMGFRCIDEVVRREMAHQKYLEEARNAAEKASRAKSLFLSNMSHDIRTPMNAITNVIDFMRSDLQDKEALLADLEQLEHSSHFLLSLVNDILDMAKIESGEMNFRPEVVRHTEFTDSLKNTIEPLSKGKGVTFEIKSIPKDISVWIDRVRLYQIFFNLLSNAVKNTPEGGTVCYEEKKIEAVDGILKADFLVSDTGCGMSKEFQKKMFLPFEREPGNANSGTGLGLSIVHKVIEKMEGTITVESEVGQGTTFIVHLEMPIATEEQMEHAAIRDKETKRRKSSLKGLRILAVEDNDVNREIILRLLRARDAVVETAGNGLEAVQQYLKRPAYYYDAILMDVQMPCMNGIEATREIRHTDRPDAETIPIIAMTANAFQDDKEATKEAGMNAHLSKPINIGQIVTVVCREVSKNKKE